MASVVIVGAGQAGYQVAASLRQGGYEGGVTLVGDEGRLPYQRPPLSKAYLKDDAAFETIMLRPPSFFRKNGIEECLGDRADFIDRSQQRVRLHSGRSLDYDQLVIATGARNRQLTISGAGLSGVRYLRHAADAEALRAALQTGRRIVIVGGGFIGLEVAAVARARGLDVTVLEAADRLMGRVVSRPVSEFFLRAHRDMGTEIRLGAALDAICGEDHVTGVRLADGETIAADLVLLAVGVLPNEELARDAGLPCRGGIAVDTYMTTADPAIFAIGDCAVFESRHAEGPVRLESVQNAVDQAKCVAARILGGAAPYDSVPWFWSDQGALKLQMVGITAQADHVELGHGTDATRLVAYCFRGDRLLGIETVNRPGEHMLGRRILAQDLRLSRADVSRGDFDLRAHLGSPDKE